jgi:hypothetical protein
MGRLLMLKEVELDRLTGGLWKAFGASTGCGRCARAGRVS